jgi:hypothetical protein
MGNALTQSDIDVVIIDPDLDAREALEAQQAADEVAFAENEPDPLDDTFEDGPAVLVDFDGGDLAFVPSEAEPASAPLVASGSPQFQLVETEDRRKQAFAAVDALPPVEKLKMFS